MNINSLIRFGKLQVNVILQLFSDNIGERGSFADSDSAMTQRTQRHLTFARQFRGIYNRLPWRHGNFSSMKRSVFSAWTVASFTRETEHVIRFEVCIDNIRVRQRLEE
jgi:hypothetical protein